MYRKRTRIFFKIALLFTLAFTTFITLFYSSTPKPTANAVSRSAYAVIDVDSKEIILGNNENTPLPMASTTKIMTALVILENCEMNDLVKIDDRAIGVEGSSVYLKNGEVLTVKDLLYCLLLRSGNDSAVALALHLCKNIEDFAEIMNIRAGSLGLSDTHFVNPHGLHDDNHYTSASDLAVISATAMKNQIFRQIVSTKNVTIGENESRRVLVNKNKMLSLYSGANGIKTGYTKKSGRCLVSSATRDGRTLVCVVLNVGDTYGLSSSLLDKGFSVING